MTSYPAYLRPPNHWGRTHGRQRLVFLLEAGLGGLQRLLSHVEVVLDGSQLALDAAELILGLVWSVSRRREHTLDRPHTA